MVKSSRGAGKHKRGGGGGGGGGNWGGNWGGKVDWTFVCAYCRCEITGETSLLQHAKGKTHASNAGGRPFKLLPNKSGWIPELSAHAQAQLRLKHDPSKAGKKPGTGDVVQKVGFSRESTALLRAALGAGNEMVDEVQSSGSEGEETETQTHSAGDAEFQRPRRRRQAFVPRRAQGNPSLQAVRESLPVLEHRAEILKAIERNQVTIVEGETGCGKTTQVAQYIVENAAESGTPCSVVCTQPRRISAISVAERVADERGEWLGGSVGYSVRLESKTGPSTCLLFCTTGILLRRLETDTDLEGTTHVVVDEVHERGVESDFLLLALRSLCRRRSDLKVILMSATMDKDLFSRYFGGAPGLTVPGRTFPVEDFFLEDALKATGHILNSGADWAIGGKGKGKGKEKGEREHLDAPKREDLADFAVRSRYGRFGERVQATLRGMEQDAVNYDLLVQLLQGDTLNKLGKGNVKDRPKGVLVFMSGAKEIEALQEALWQTDEFKEPPARSWVLPLHGGLPTDDQKRVFDRPPEGLRKIVISTNVAETAITINDIGYVVDSCRMKELRYDAIRCMSSLEDTVVSRTNARQRRGRAGRVAPGLCVHLGLTRHRHDNLIDDHQPPEVQRTPLEQLILRIHAVRLHLQDPSGKAAAICSQLLEPPKMSFVEKGVEALVRLGALSVEPPRQRESLTPLGEHLAHLPVEARLGKLVLYGAAFGPAATDAALTMAAGLTSRNPFVAPLESREEAAKAKKKFAEKMIVGPVGPSDHLAVLAAYNEWDRIPPQGEARFEFCRENFLSIKTLQGMSELKRSLLEMLSETGFVRHRLRAKEVGWTGRRRDGTDGVLLALSEGFTVEPCPPALVAALLCAALFPQVATATMPQLSQPKSWKAKQNAKSDENQPKPKLLIRDAETKQPVKVKMHPGSVSAKETKLSSPYIAFQELVKSAGADGMLMVRDVTPVPPLALALFSGSLKAAGSASKGDAQIVIDDWIKLAVPAAQRLPILQTRKRLDALLASWVGRRGGENGSCLQDQGSKELLRVIVELLSAQEECAPTAPQKQQSQQNSKKQAGSWQWVSDSSKKSSSGANNWSGGWGSGSKKSGSNAAPWAASSAGNAAQKRIFSASSAGNPAQKRIFNAAFGSKPGSIMPLPKKWRT